MHFSFLLAAFLGAMASPAVAHNDSKGQDHDARVWTALGKSIGKRDSPTEEPLSKSQTAWSPPANLTQALSEVWEHEVSTYSNGLFGFKNYGWDQLMAANGTVNLCVRWESNHTVDAATRAKILSAAQRSYARWYSWLYAFDNFPYTDIPVNIVGWAVSDASLLTGNTGNMTVYAGDTDDQGAPQCAPACGKFFQKGNDYSGCAGGQAQHYDHTLWLTDGFEGGVGGDWGARLGTEYFLEALDQTEMHIYEHEIGHIYGLDDFYDWQPTGQKKFIMWAGTSSVITEFDGWMLRNWWYELSRNRGWQNSTASPGASISSLTSVALPVATSKAIEKSKTAETSKAVATDINANITTSAAASTPTPVDLDQDADSGSGCDDCPTTADGTSATATNTATATVTVTVTATSTDNGIGAFPFPFSSTSTVKPSSPAAPSQGSDSEEATVSSLPFVPTDLPNGFPGGFFGGLPDTSSVEPRVSSNVAVPTVVPSAIPSVVPSGILSGSPGGAFNGVADDVSGAIPSGISSAIAGGISTSIPIATETLANTPISIPTSISSSIIFQPSTLMTKTKSKTTKTRTTTKTNTHTHTQTNGSAAPKTVTSTEISTPTAASRVMNLATPEDDSGEQIVESIVNVDVYVNADAGTTASAVPTTISTSVRPMGAKTIILESPWQTEAASDSKIMTLGRLSVCNGNEACDGEQTCYSIVAGYGICA
ncbi:hypothetical protein TD95_004219 [Thielaviopsis punctulata]|uniref:Uncharacterized protein n=1 Tax=Thielaviopsis punctulata TaxID=72032 RepID=A0A0F4ZC99_9PEZI|nr:hypothetical protein TD95_004219 [Thielaviopsis punctulata]